MAIVEVKVPQLSESVAEATMLQWKKKPGESVAIDEILIEIETDKVVLEVPAPSAGVLAEIVVADGGMVVSDQVIARIDSEGKAGAAAPKAAAAPTAAVASAPVSVAISGGSMAGVAMPAAAKLMADNSLAAGSVAGSGKDGRVTRVMCSLLWLAVQSLLLPLRQLPCLPACPLLHSRKWLPPPAAWPRNSLAAQSSAYP